MITHRFEQETTITAGRDDELVQIWTSNTVDLRQLRKDTRFVEISGGSDWGQFVVPTSAFHPIRGLRRRSGMSEEQRAAAGERLRSARSRSSGGASV